MSNRNRPIVMARRATRTNPARPAIGPGPTRPASGPFDAQFRVAPAPAPAPAANPAPAREWARVWGWLRSMPRPVAIGLASVAGIALAYAGLAGFVTPAGANIVIGLAVAIAGLVWLNNRINRPKPAATLEQSRMSQREFLTRTYQNTNAPYRDRLRAAQLLMALEDKIEVPG